MNSQDRNTNEVSSSESEVLCKYFLTSSCKKGDKCVFSHDLSTLEKYSSSTICRFYARGYCTNGQNCYFLHEQPRVKVKSKNNVFPQYLEESSESIMGGVCYKNKRKRETCNYFLYGFCYRGDDCQFKHSNNKPHCSFYSLGTCRFGDLCRNAHIKLEKDFSEEKCSGFIPPSENIDSNNEKSSISSQLYQKQTIIDATTCSSSTQSSISESASCLIESSEKIGSVIDPKKKNKAKSSISSELNEKQTIIGTTSRSSTLESSNSESISPIKSSASANKQKNELKLNDKTRKIEQR